MEARLTLGVLVDEAWEELTLEQGVSGYSPPTSLSRPQLQAKSATSLVVKSTLGRGWGSKWGMEHLKEVLFTGVAAQQVAQSTPMHIPRASLLLVAQSRVMPTLVQGPSILH